MQPMTEDDKNACLGQLATDYSNNETEIAQLREHLSQVGKRLTSLGQTLVRCPEKVAGSDHQARALMRLEEATVHLEPFPAIDPEAIKRNVANLHVALDKKATFEQRLQAVGMGNLIRS